MAADMLEDLMRHAVSEATLVADGILTRPRSYGVYDIGLGHGGTKRYRFGNHPIRGTELRAEFGQARVVAIFLERQHARAVANIRNGNR